MERLAFLFPGQGAQQVGMGSELYRNFQEARETFEAADRVLGYPLSEMCFSGPEEELKKTFRTQPAVLTASVAAARVMMSEGIVPAAVCGLSLGEFSALVAAGALEFAECCTLVERRGQLMQEAVPENVGGMGAVIGLPDREVEAICREVRNGGVLTPANFNCPGQVVISGHLELVNKALELAAERGARKVVPLPVSAPFHCELMTKAAEEIAREFARIELRDPNCTYVSNVTAGPAKEGEKIKELLIRQTYHPVYFSQCIDYLIKEEGCTVFIEAGPGRALTSFVKRISKDVHAFSVSDVASLKKTLKQLEKVM